MKRLSNLRFFFCCYPFPLSSNRPSIDNFFNCTRSHTPPTTISLSLSPFFCAIYIADIMIDMFSSISNDHFPHDITTKYDIFFRRLQNNTKGIKIIKFFLICYSFTKICQPHNFHPAGVRK